MIRINEIKLSLDEEESLLSAKASKILKINEKYIKSLTIYKKSIDARKKDDVHFTYSVDVEIALDEEQITRKCKSNKVSLAKPYVYEVPACQRKSEFRPIVVGFGPAGMLAGIVLAEAGLRPIILERGKGIDERTRDVNERSVRRRRSGNFLRRKAHDGYKKPLYPQGARRTLRGGRARGNSLFR